MYDHPKNSWRGAKNPKFLSVHSTKYNLVTTKPKAPNTKGENDLHIIFLQIWLLVSIELQLKWNQSNKENEKNCEHKV